MIDHPIDLMHLIAAIAILVFGGCISGYALWTSAREEGDYKMAYVFVAVLAFVGTFIVVGNLLQCFK